MSKLTDCKTRFGDVVSIPAKDVIAVVEDLKDLVVYLNNGNFFSVADKPQDLIKAFGATMVPFQGILGREIHVSPKAVTSLRAADIAEHETMIGIAGDNFLRVVEKQGTVFSKLAI